MTPLERLHDVAQTPINQWSHRFSHHRPVGIYNAYVPEEMFHAAGLTPVYLFHRSGDQGYARAHLPSFACWPGRSLVDQALSGELDRLVGMAFAQTCDMVQALTDLWRQLVPRVPVYHVNVPLNLATPAAHHYLVAELKLLRQTLGGVPDDALHQAFSTYNRTRELLEHVYKRAVDLAPTDLYATLRAGFLMPKDEYNKLLTQLIAQLPQTQFHGPRLILIGPHLADPTPFQIIEETGGRVVDDLLDLGHRYLAVPVTINGDPIVALVNRLLATLPTPTKHHPDRRRDKHLIKQVVKKQADGVIFARQKFCDPHGFDYVELKSELDREGIPHLLLELEQTSQVGQMRTRVEAFIETIGL